MSLVALISDFGTHDWFVAELKGVILSVSPISSIVDITHEITPGDVRSAAFVLYSCYKRFPVGTTFCIAVDPGSNEEFPVIVTKTDCYSFVSPDNGITTLALKSQKNCLTFKCSNSSFFHTSSPSIFRGRDIIAPIAAHCAKKIDPSHFGTPYKIANQLELPQAIHTDKSIASEIIYIDRFGNCITGIRNNEMDFFENRTVFLTIAKNAATIPIAQSYDSVSPGNFLLYKGSADYLEIAVNGGNAANLLDVSLGDSVNVRLES